MRRLLLALALAACGDNELGPDPIAADAPAECVCEPTEDIEALQACARDQADVEIAFPVCLTVPCLVGEEELLVSFCVAPE